MKIAVVGSAPSSVRMAPYGDPAWKIWGCSPGLYYVATRIDAWFEVHRWEPPVIGRPEGQKPWFSPEYVAWMHMQKLVWMATQVPGMKGCQLLPWQHLVKKYGHYNFTSTIAWMMAMAIEEILADRAKRESIEEDMIGLWGVDMSATEEYGYQRAACQFFAQLAWDMGIKIWVPPESDLMAPPPLYGISESFPKVIKILERQRELEAKMNAAKAQAEQANRAAAFFEGAMQDNLYHQNTWANEGDSLGVDYALIFRSGDIGAKQATEASAPLAVTEPSNGEDGSPVPGPEMQAAAFPPLS